MNAQRSRGMWVVALSFVLAILLAVFPLPGWLQWARPEWVALVLIYWVIALPQRIGLVAAFSVGLAVDLVEGATPGQNALALAVVAYLSFVLYQRVRVFNSWQQAAVVFVLVGINQLVCQWVQGAVAVGAQSLAFLLPALISAMLWPGVLSLLRHVRRSYGVA